MPLLLFYLLINTYHNAHSKYQLTREKYTCPPTLPLTILSSPTCTDRTLAVFCPPLPKRFDREFPLDRLLLKDKYGLTVAATLPNSVGVGVGSASSSSEAVVDTSVLSDPVRLLQHVVQTTTQRTPLPPHSNALRNLYAALPLPQVVQAVATVSSDIANRGPLGHYWGLANSQQQPPPQAQQQQRYQMVHELLREKIATHARLVEALSRSVRATLEVHACCSPT